MEKLMGKMASVFPRCLISLMSDKADNLLHKQATGLL